MKLALTPVEYEVYKKDYPKDVDKSFVNVAPEKKPKVVAETSSEAIVIPKETICFGDVTLYPENEWVSFNLDSIGRTTDFTKPERDRYEWFCAGYLSYYDTMVRNDAVDHAIYFKWEPKKVTIYLNPAPMLTPHYMPTAVTQTDPPKPSGPPPPPLK